MNSGHASSRPEPVARGGGDKPVTVAVIRSLSFTGTTWLNTVLGGHENALVLGPADRLWRFVNGEETGDLCRVHGGSCDFWPGFLARYVKARTCSWRSPGTRANRSS